MNVISKICRCTDNFIIPISAFSENVKPMEIWRNEKLHIININDKTIEMKCEYGDYRIEIPLRLFIEYFEIVK